MTTIQGIMAVTFPVLLGFVIWLLQQLVQRSWNLYEEKRRVYIEVVTLLDSLFESGDPAGRKEYLMSIRSAWLVGSDEVVRAIGALHADIRTSHDDSKRQELYSDLIKEMRQDLHRRSYLPPGRTKLCSDDFPIESAGRPQKSH